MRSIAVEAIRRFKWLFRVAWVFIAKDLIKEKAKFGGLIDILK